MMIRNFIGTLGRPLWIVLGALSLAVGAMGALLPVLPTTPFVILAAFAFARSSPRLARVLNQHRIFGPMIADWRLRGAIATRYKLLALFMMATAWAVSVAASLSNAIIGIQAVAMLGAATFILTRPSS